MGRHVMGGGRVSARGCGLAVALVVVGALTSVTGPADAAFPGTPGRLLFVEDVDTPAGPRTDIRSMAPDGTGVRTVMTGAWQPATSPDGRQVAYTDYPGGVPQVFVMEADGSGARQVTRFAHGAEKPDWSPDGTRLVVARYDDDSYMLTSLWTLRASDGTDARQVVAATDAAGRPIFAWDPAWSVADRIAFSAVAHGRDGGEDAIFTVRPDGTGQARLTTGTGAFSPDWSPDGARVVFQRSHDGAANTLHVIDATGAGERRLVDVDGWAQDPVWSPDGTDVAFWTAGGAATDGLYVVAADGRGLRLVRRGATSPSWQPVPGPTDDPAEVSRHTGPDRIATAIAVSGSSFASDRSAGIVVLARADTFPDALAGVPLAVAEGGPLLLTGREALDERTAREIQRVLAPRAPVVLLGGAAALSAAVEDRLQDLGLATRRLAGADRYETAARIAEAVGGSGPAFLATGWDFPDALGAGAAAAHTGGTVLLTAGDVLPAATRARLRVTSPDRVYAVGGHAARALPSATPLVGADRYATARRVATVVFDAPAAVGVASGTSFPDGLAGGVHAGRLGAPLLLVAPTTLPDPTAGYLDATPSVRRAHVYGGAVAVGYGVTTEIGRHIEDR